MTTAPPAPTPSDVPSAGLFDHLETTLKGPARHYALGPLTAFLGRIRSGKSAAVDSITYALEGTAGGARRDDLIMSQSPTGVVRVRLTGRAGDAERSCPAGAGPTSVKLVAPIHILPAGLPMGDAKLRDAIVSFYASAAVLDPPPDLDPDQATLWREVMAEVASANPSEPPASRLAIAREKFAKLQRENNTVANRARAQIDIDMENLSSATADVAGLEDQLEAAVRAESAQQNLAAYQAHVAAAERASAALADLEARSTARGNELVAERAALDHEMTTARSAAAVSLEATERLRAAQGYAEEVLQVIRKADFTSGCPFCGGPGTGAKSAERALVDFVASTRAKLAALATATRNISALTARIEQNTAAARSLAERHIREKELHVRARNDSLAAVAALKAAQQQAASTPYSGPPAAEIRRKLTEARAQQDAVERSRGAIELRRADLSASGALAKRAEACSYVATRQIKRLTETAHANAENAIQTALPEGEWEARLLLTAKKCNPQLRGTDGDWHSREALSGSERVLLRLAVELAFAPEGLRLLRLDDEDWGYAGREGQKALLPTLVRLVSEGRVAQVVLASSHLQEEDFEADDWLLHYLTPTASNARPSPGANGSRPAEGDFQVEAIADFTRAAQ